MSNTVARSAGPGSTPAAGRVQQGRVDHLTLLAASRAQAPPAHGGPFCDPARGRGRASALLRPGHRAPAATGNGGWYSRGAGVLGVLSRPIACCATHGARFALAAWRSCVLTALAPPGDAYAPRRTAGTSDRADMPHPSPGRAPQAEWLQTRVHPREAWGMRPRAGVGPSSSPGHSYRPPRKPSPCPRRLLAYSDWEVSACVCACVRHCAV